MVFHGSLDLAGCGRQWWTSAIPGFWVHIPILSLSGVWLYPGIALKSRLWLKKKKRMGLGYKDIIDSVWHIILHSLAWSPRQKPMPCPASCYEEITEEIIKSVTGHSQQRTGTFIQQPQRSPVTQESLGEPRSRSFPTRASIPTALLQSFLHTENATR